MRVFVDCLTKRLFEGLIRSGTPSFGELNSAWLHLYSEYLERIQDGQIESFLERIRLIDALTSRLSRMGKLLGVAALIASEEIAEAFAAEGFKLDINAEEDAYFQQLRIINARLIQDSMRLDRLLTEQDSEQQKEEVTQATFINILMDISKHEGFRIRLEDITVGEYCAYFCRMRNYREQMAQAAQRANAA